MRGIQNDIITTALQPMNRVFGALTFHMQPASIKSGGGG